MAVRTESNTSTDQRSHIPQGVVDRAVHGSMLWMNQLRHQKWRALLWTPVSLVSYHVEWGFVETDLCNTKTKAEDYTTDNEQRNVISDRDQRNTAQHETATNDHAGASAGNIGDIWDDGNGKHGAD